MKDAKETKIGMETVAEDELSVTELDVVSGGINPQPLPPVSERMSYVSDDYCGTGTGHPGIHGPVGPINPGIIQFNGGVR